MNTTTCEFLDNLYISKKVGCEGKIIRNHRMRFETFLLLLSSEMVPNGMPSRIKGNPVRIRNSTRCCKSPKKLTQPATGIMLGRRGNRDKSEDLPWLENRLYLRDHGLKFYKKVGISCSLFYPFSFISLVLESMLIQRIWRNFTVKTVCFPCRVCSLWCCAFSCRATKTRKLWHRRPRSPRSHSKTGPAYIRSRWWSR